MTIIVNGSNTPTAGAVGYGDGTNLAFTSAGTTGQFLSSNGSSAPSWVGAPASAMTLISTQTATLGTTSSIQWTGLSGYDKYMFVFENFIPSGTSYIQCLVGYGGTPTYITSSYTVSALGFYNGSNIYPYQSTTRAAFTICGNATSIDSASTAGGSGQFLLSGTNNTTGITNIDGISFYFNSSSGYTNMDTTTGWVANSNPVTAIKLQFQSGATFSGKASLYGISS